MGIGDYLWPFERKFKDIPCAREAGLAACLGGPVTGALVMIATGRHRTTIFATTYSAFAYFWLTIIVCRYQDVRSRRLADKFKEAIAENKLD